MADSLFDVDRGLASLAVSLRKKALDAKEAARAARAEAARFAPGGANPDRHSHARALAAVVKARQQSANYLACFETAEGGAYPRMVNVGPEHSFGKAFAPLESAAAGMGRLKLLKPIPVDPAGDDD